MRLIRHPLVGQDLIALVDHIVEMTQGDFAAAERRLDEIDALLADIADNPMSGMRLQSPMKSWLVRYGGQRHRLTIVFRAEKANDAIYVALVAFGGQDWMTTGAGRSDWGQ